MLPAHCMAELSVTKFLRISFLNLNLCFLYSYIASVDVHQHYLYLKEKETTYAIFYLLTSVYFCSLFMLSVYTVRYKKETPALSCSTSDMDLYLSLLSVHGTGVTGIGTIWDIGKFGDIIRPEEINLIPFSDTSFITCFLNAFMFMPFGFLLPLIWKNYHTLTNVVLAASAYSLAIELCQLFNRRRTDIDDLLMNTLGAAVGFFCWRLFDLCFKKRRKKAVSLSRWEAAFYLSLSIGGQFFFLNWYWLL